MLALDALFWSSEEITQSFVRSLTVKLARSLVTKSHNFPTLVMDDAHLPLALPSALFAAVGTCGQRCTTCRRLVR